MDLKVLVVEDNLIIQLFIKKLLQNMGYEVATAKNDIQALSFLKNHNPDLVLLDINLGNGLDGIEIAQIINEQYQIPFAYVSGNTDVITMERANNTKPLSFISKPIDEYKLKMELDLIKEEINSLLVY